MKRYSSLIAISFISLAWGIPSMAQAESMFPNHRKVSYQNLSTSQNFHQATTQIDARLNHPFDPSYQGIDDSEPPPR